MISSGAFHETRDHIKSKFPCKSFSSSPCGCGCTAFIYWEQDLGTYIFGFGNQAPESSCRILKSLLMMSNKYYDPLHHHTCVHYRNASISNLSSRLLFLQNSNSPRSQSPSCSFKSLTPETFSPTTIPPRSKAFSKAFLNLASS